MWRKAEKYSILYEVVRRMWAIIAILLHGVFDRKEVYDIEHDLLEIAKFLVITIVIILSTFVDRGQLYSLQFLVPIRCLQLYACKLRFGETLSKAFSS